MGKVKILIVEDESIVALDIKRAVTKLGHEVVKTVTNYDDALEIATQYRVDIILMDINLENSKDGIQTATDIQNIIDIPIIYLTAFTDDETISRAVQTNPVAYLNKPFRREELKSSILLAIYKIKKPKEFKADATHAKLGLGYHFDLEHDDLYYDNMPIKLSVKEKQLLRILVEAKGELVPFSEIEYFLWPDGSVSGSSLRTLTYRLRAKLEHKLIETIPSFGCKLIPLE